MTESIKHSEDIFYISDDRNWVDSFVFRALDPLKLRYVKVPSNITIRQSWERLKDAKHIVVHWEGRHRRGGAIVEEILDVDSYFDIAERVVVITTDPTREDVVYFGELGIKKIVRLRNNKRFFEEAFGLLQSHIKNPLKESAQNVAWQRLIKSLDMAADDMDEDKTAKFETRLEELHQSEPADSARYIDAKGLLVAKRGEYEESKRLFTAALDQNSQYYRSYNNLIKLHVQHKELDSAIALCRKMHSLNKENISRLVDMGEIFYMKGELEKAETHFKAALERDEYCSKALNGLAQVHFDRDEINESRALLAKSNLAYILAKALNEEGIKLVTDERFEEALEHYSKAQYVIPMQDKGPMLFFNIGLCYSRWGKYEMAKEFLKIALIKEPNYKKAKKLLEFVNSKTKKSVLPNSA